MSLEKKIENIVNSFGARLYDIEILTQRGQKIYRVTITNKEGVDLDLCAKISNAVSPLLDIEPPIRGDYSLEVSSPGVERRLRKLSHFQNSVNENVKIVFKDGKSIEGILRNATEDGIEIEVLNTKKYISFDEIASAKTVFKW